MAKDSFTQPKVSAGEPSARGNFGVDDAAQEQLDRLTVLQDVTEAELA